MIHYIIRTPYTIHYNVQSRGRPDSPFRVSDVTINVLLGVVAMGNIRHRRGALGLPADNA